METGRETGEEKRARGGEGPQRLAGEQTDRWQGEVSALAASFCWDSTEYEYGVGLVKNTKGR